MDKGTHKNLKKEKKKHARALSQALVKGESINKAREHKEWLEILTWAINSSMSSKKHALSRTQIFAVVLLVVISLTISFVWSQQRSTTHISFEIITSNVGLTLGSKWELTESLAIDERLVINRIEIDNLDTVLAEESNIKFFKGLDNDQKTAKLIMTGENMLLDMLTLPEKVSIDLTTEDNSLIFYAKGGPLHCEIFTHQANLKFILIDNETNINIEDVEFVNIVSSRTKNNLVTLKLDISEDDWTLRNLHTTHLNFTQEYLPGRGKFVSTIKSGNINIVETGEKEELRKDDMFHLEDITTRRLELSKTNDGFKVFFEGSARVIKAGPIGFEKNLAPTHLEYLYHQQKVGFILSIMGSILGLLLGFKRLLSN